MKIEEAYEFLITFSKYVENAFIRSLARQYQERRSLSEAQYNAFVSFARRSEIAVRKNGGNLPVFPPYKRIKKVEYSCGNFQLYSAKDPAWNEEVKGNGGRWNECCWELPSRRFLKIAGSLCPFDDWIYSETAYTVVSEQSIVPAEKQTEVDFSPRIPPEWSLRPYQEIGIKWIVENVLNKKGVILADEMGTGKTLQSLSAAAELSRRLNTGIVVICPRSMRGDWLKLAALMEVRISIYTSSAKGVPDPTELECKDYILIVDECHYYANTTSQRTGKFLSLCEHSKCKGVILLSGTISKNGRPKELISLLTSINSPLMKEGEWNYKKKYCDAHKKYVGNGRTVWDFNGASNLEELKEGLKPQLLRRLKKDVLKDLPEFQRTLKQIELTDAEQRQYEAEIKQLLEEFEIACQQGNKNPHAAALIALTTYRRIGAKYKAPKVLELLEEFPEQKLVIFSNFREPIDYLLDQLGGRAVKLTGDLSDKEREFVKDRFQNDPSCDVFLGTVQAGGVGLTLTSSSTVILIDRPWTPGDTRQAEDRIHRVGQTMPCFSFWLQLGETDTEIDTLLVNKQSISDKIVGEQSDFSVVDRAEELMRKMVSTFSKKKQK